MLNKFKNSDGTYNKKKVFFGTLGVVAVIGGVILSCKSNNNFPDIKEVASFANEMVVGGSKVVYDTVDDLASKVASATTEINQFDFMDIVSSLPSDISADELLTALGEVSVTVTNT